MQTGPLGAVAQRRLDAFLRAHGERRLKEPGMIDEALAFAGAGLAVAREPRAQGAGGQRVRAQGLQETSGTLGVGARQHRECRGVLGGGDRRRAG